tara:strand:+ start:1004 stop:1171 length:168 start_codon:yes stop_codon:yes gene_type:complete
MFGISFFPVYGCVVGVNLKDSAMDEAFEEVGDYIMIQLLFFVFGITLIYYVGDTE